MQPTTRQAINKPPKVGRNESCYCGSGRKFKKCCLDKQPLRKVDVFRDGDWREVRLTEVRKGERFRMWEKSGQLVIDKHGKTEWVARTNGFINGRGVGSIEIVEDDKNPIPGDVKAERGLVKIPNRKPLLI